MKHTYKKYSTSDTPGTGIIRTCNPEGINVCQATFLYGRLMYGFSFSDKIETDPVEGAYQRIIAKFKVKKSKI